MDGLPISFYHNLTTYILSEFTREKMYYSYQGKLMFQKIEYTSQYLKHTVLVCHRIMFKPKYIKHARLWINEKM